MRTASEDREWPGAAPRGPGEGDVEEVLRRALRSAADCVEPAGDGLTRIFRRLAAPWLVRQMSLLATDCADLLRLITIWLQPMFARAMPVLAAAAGSMRRALRRRTSLAAAAAPIFRGRHHPRQDRAATFWGRPPALKARARLRTAAAWLRPALMVAVTVVVVMIGTVTLSRTVVRINLSGNAGAGASAGPGAAPATAGRWQSPPAASPSSSPAPTPTPSHHRPRQPHQAHQQPPRPRPPHPLRAETPDH